jgi:hypothetical protein
VLLVVGIGGCSVFVLAPSGGWVFTNDARILVDGWIEAESPATIDDMHRNIALIMNRNEVRNRAMLQTRFNVYRVGLGLLLAETILLLAGFTVLR